MVVAPSAKPQHVVITTSAEPQHVVVWVPAETEHVVLPTPLAESKHVIITAPPVPEHLARVFRQSGPLLHAVILLLEAVVVPEKQHLSGLKRCVLLVLLLAVVLIAQGLGQDAEGVIGIRVRLGHG